MIFGLALNPLRLSWFIICVDKVIVLLHIDENVEDVTLRCFGVQASGIAREPEEGLLCNRRMN